MSNMVMAGITYISIKSWGKSKRLELFLLTTDHHLSIVELYFAGPQPLHTASRWRCTACGRSSADAVHAMLYNPMPPVVHSIMYTN
jgi:hypothetical protein